MTIIESLRNLHYPVTEEDISLLAEVAYNVLYGTVPLTEAEKELFKLHKPALRILISKRYSVKRKLVVLSKLLVEKLIEAALRHLDG